MQNTNTKYNYKIQIQNTNTKYKYKIQTQIQISNYFTHNWPNTSANSCVSFLSCATWIWRRLISRGGLEESLCRQSLKIYKFNKYKYKYKFKCVTHTNTFFNAALHLHSTYKNIISRTSVHHPNFFWLICTSYHRNHHWHLNFWRSYVQVMSAFVRWPFVIGFQGDLCKVLFNFIKLGSQWDYNIYILYFNLWFTCIGDVRVFEMTDFWGLPI